MAKIIFLASLALVLLCLYWLRRKAMVSRRQRLIDSYPFPATISTRLIRRYPHLSISQAAAAIDGLREYFHLCNMAGERVVAMPSQVVDAAWHEFILFTRHYELFCRKALGRFLHHTPAEAMAAPTLAQAGIRTAWRLSCARENIPARAPHKLPLLFAIDTELNIADGFRYSLDCRKEAGTAYYCAGHIGCGSSCSSDCGGDAGCSSGCGGD